MGKKERENPHRSFERGSTRARERERARARERERESERESESESRSDRAREQESGSGICEHQRRGARAKTAEHQRQRNECKDCQHVKIKTAEKEMGKKGQRGNEVGKGWCTAENSVWSDLGVLRACCEGEQVKWFKTSDPEEGACALTSPCVRGHHEIDECARSCTR